MSESSEGEEWGAGSDERTWTSDKKLLERSQVGKEEQGGSGGGINLGCGPVPSGGRRDIGTQGIGCGSGQDGDRNDRLDDNGNGYTEGDPVCYLQSTTIRVIGEFYLP